MIYTINPALYRAAQLFAATPKTSNFLPMLERIRLERVGDSIYIVATDNAAMFVGRDTERCNDNTPHYAEGICVSATLPVKPATKRIELTADACVIDGATFPHPDQALQFPRWRNVIPLAGTAPGDSHMHADQMERIAKAARILKASIYWHAPDDITLASTIKLIAIGNVVAHIVQMPLRAPKDAGIPLGWLQEVRA